jgi:pyruvate/2-oxoglutarate dehydrogenase complex dihydrolipoamide dehydrogenase (E3) component
LQNHHPHDIEGLDDIDYLTSTSILELEKVPEHLLIIGGNYIGLEFGQMFRRFGSKVTILERSDRLISREDEDISIEITRILEEEGIKVLTNTKAFKFKNKGKNQITATVKTGEGKQNKMQPCAGSRWAFAANRQACAGKDGV